MICQLYFYSSGEARWFSGNIKALKIIPIHKAGQKLTTVECLVVLARRRGAFFTWLKPGSVTGRLCMGTTPNLQCSTAKPSIFHLKKTKFVGLSEKISAVIL